MLKIDALDQKILEIISLDARVPFKDIAEVTGVSRAAVHQRVQRLIDHQVIKGSCFEVEPKAIGYNTCTYVGITLERGSMYGKVAEALEKIPEIIECHFTTGPYTMLVKLFSRDNHHLMQLLNGQIQQITGVMSTETLISLEQTINRPMPIILSEEVMKLPRNRSEKEPGDSVPDGERKPIGRPKGKRGRKKKVEEAEVADVLSEEEEDLL